MTPTEKRKARHALGLPNDGNRSYRNRYYATFKSPDYLIWMAMVRKGLAERGMFRITKPRFFWLTRTGANLALEPGETLDAEDFPPKPERDPLKVNTETPIARS